jgi:hypothetical protein
MTNEALLGTLIVMTIIIFGVAGTWFTQTLVEDFLDRQHDKWLRKEPKHIRRITRNDVR